MNCMTCGSPVLAVQRFCAQCSSPLPPVVPAPSQPAPMPYVVQPRRRRSGLIWRITLVCVAVLLVMGAVGVLLANDVGTHTQLSNTRGDLASTDRRLSSTETQLGQTRTQLQSADQQVSSLQTSVANLKGSLANAQNTVNGQNGEITLLQTCLDGVIQAGEDGNAGDYTDELSALEGVQAVCQEAQGDLPSSS
jgi:hypothetical protein